MIVFLMLAGHMLDVGHTAADFGRVMTSPVNVSAGGHLPPQPSRSPRLGQQQQQQQQQGRGRHPNLTVVIPNNRGEMPNTADQMVSSRGEMITSYCQTKPRTVIL